jgi:uncharacterized tellurite resistance protein B-like protein
MSEIILKAILKLFAIVAKQDDVTRQEREQIRIFLNDHVAENMVDGYLAVFDEYAKSVAVNKRSDATVLREVCAEINQELTQKQKVVIVLELVRIVMADAQVSAQEEDLMKVICDEFKIKPEDLSSIRKFIVGQRAVDLDHPALLIVDSHEDKSFLQAKQISRSHLNGFIEIL